MHKVARPSNQHNETVSYKLKMQGNAGGSATHGTDKVRKKKAIEAIHPPGDAQFDPQKKVEIVK